MRNILTIFLCCSALQLNAVEVPQSIFSTVSAEIPAESTIPSPIESIQSNKSVLISRIILGVTCVSFLGAGLYYNRKSESYIDRYVTLQNNSQQSLDTQWDRVSSAEGKRNVFYSLSAVSAVGFTVTFRF